MKISNQDNAMDNGQLQTAFVVMTRGGRYYIVYYVKVLAHFYSVYSMIIITLLLWKFLFSVSLQLLFPFRFFFF